MSQVDQRNTGGRTTVVSYSAQAHFTGVGSQQSSRPIVGAGAVSRVIVIEQQQIAKERLTELSGVAQERGKASARSLGAWVNSRSVLRCWPGSRGSCSARPGFRTARRPRSRTRSGRCSGQTLAMTIPRCTPDTVTAFSHSSASLPSSGRSLRRIRAGWSRYLYAVPLAYVVVGLLAIYLNVNKVVGEMVKAGVPSPFSWHWGVFVLVFAAVVLAA